MLGLKIALLLHVSGARFYHGSITREDVIRAAGNAAHWVECDMPRKKTVASAGVQGSTDAPALDCCNAQGDVINVTIDSVAEGTLAKKAVTERLGCQTDKAGRNTGETGAGAKEGAGAGVIGDARVPTRNSPTTPFHKGWRTCFSGA